MLINVFLVATGGLSRASFVQLNSRSSKSKMIILKFINEANYVIECHAYQLETCIDYDKEKRIELKSAEL